MPTTGRLRWLPPVEPENPASRYRWDLGISWYEEIRDSGPNFFFERLPVGEDSCKSRIRAATAGTFGPGHLKAVKDVLPREVAVYAVGGVGAGNLDAWRSAGVDGIGVGGELYRPGDGAADVAERAARLVTAWMA